MDRNLLLTKLAGAITDVRLPHPTRVAIDGVDGVGKTTLADELADFVRRAGRHVIRASIDGFHNPRQRRYARGPDSAEGYFLDSFNYEALGRALLMPLGPGGDRIYRVAMFDHRADVTVESEAQRASNDAVLLFDGVFLLRAELVPHWDLSIWVDAPFDVTLERAVRRDSSEEEREELRWMYERRYVPGQRMYLERCRPIQRADLVVKNANVEDPGLEVRKEGGSNV